MASFFGSGARPLMRSITTMSRLRVCSSFCCLPPKTIIRNYYYYSQQNDPPDSDQFEFLFTTGASNRRLHTLNSNPKSGGGQNYVFHSAKQTGEKWNCPVAAVALLIGWVGSEQRHLREFAEWYTARGIHAITISLPMVDLLSYYMGSRAQQDTKLLVQTLDKWLSQDKDKHTRSLIVHTCCAGWLAYSFVLDTILEHYQHLTAQMKGCIIDSSPLAKPDPQIWAKGFSIAIFKKRSSFIATDGAVGKPNAMEPVVVALLHKIFSVFFNHPRVKRRFNHTIELLSRNQPPYPQLYLYSSGDRVLPVQIVKDFVEEQKRCGRQVDSHDFVWSPHVGHLRCQPDIYTNLLTRFLNNCLCSTSTH